MSSTSSPSEDILTLLTADCEPSSKTEKSVASGEPEIASDIFKVTVFVPATALADERTGAMVSFVTVTSTGLDVVASALPEASDNFALSFSV